MNKEKSTDEHGWTRIKKISAWGAGVLACFLAISWMARPRFVELPQGVSADRVIVEKSRRLLTVYSGGKVLKSYPISLGRSPEGAKVREGDNRTPEGEYLIDWRNPRSAYHLSLHISYPSPADRERAAKSGYDAGGAIMIHGLRKGLGWIGRMHRIADWTRGCIAVTNPEIEELWRIIPNGTTIHIQP